jgi:16S rRNA (adenine1518-N6/adenine1519-N6)-dimethyltransferase
MLPKKLLGQHFLKNPALLRKLTELAGVRNEDIVVEIGAGMGDLTLELARRTKFVYSFELDRVLYEKLMERFSAIKNIKLVRADFLKHNFGEISKEYREKLKIVANIPYKITTPLLLKFINEIEYIKDCHILLQKEVAQRITSMPGNKNYGSLTVLLQVYFNIKILKYINRGSFSPPPKVDSAFVKLEPRQLPEVEKTKLQDFSRFLRLCFSRRRKIIYNILNSLKIIPPDELHKLLEETGIKPSARPEELKVEELVRVFKYQTTLTHF